MPGMFITPEDRIPIAETGAIDPLDVTPEIDVIYIYPVMPAAVEARVVSRAVTIRQAQQQAPVQRGKPGKGKQAPKAESSYDAGAYNMAILEVNILGWSGPSFVTPGGQPIPCTPERIRQLNPKMPLVAMVLQEIGERNAPAEAAADDAGEGHDPNEVEALGG